MIHVARTGPTPSPRGARGGSPQGARAAGALRAVQWTKVADRFEPHRVAAAVLLMLGTRSRSRAVRDAQDSALRAVKTLPLMRLDVAEQTERAAATASTALGELPREHQVGTALALAYMLLDTAPSDAVWTTVQDAIATLERLAGERAEVHVRAAEAILQRVLVTGAVTAAPSSEHARTGGGHGVVR